VGVAGSVVSTTGRGVVRLSEFVKEFPHPDKSMVAAIKKMRIFINRRIANGAVVKFTWPCNLASEGSRSKCEWSLDEYLCSKISGIASFPP
jgi:hypothetical protein